MTGDMLYAWDDTNKVWVKIKTDSQGRLYTVAVIDELDDIGDVNVPTPTDDDLLYWDEAAGMWQDIAHLGVTDAHHTKYTNSEGKAAAVQSGAIIDGVTKAPTHDAVFDVKTTADAAQTSGEVDTKITNHKDTSGAHHSATASITFIIDGGGSAITTGQKGHLEIPFACLISRVTMLADRSGSIVVDIWKRVYADFPPTDAQSITSSAVPTISGAVKSQDGTLTGWTTAIAAGDILAFNVDSITDIQRLTISLKVTKL